MNRFEMLVEDIFYFENGRTVFIGTLDGDISYIKAGSADIIVDNEVKSTITIEDEMMPLRRKDKTIRSICTRDKLNDELRAVPPLLISVGFIR